MQIHDKLSTDQLKVLLKHKKAMQHMDISPILSHHEISLELFKFINHSDYCPNIQSIKMVQCSFLVQNDNELSNAHQILTKAKETDNLFIQTIPSWFIGSWINYSDTDITRRSFTKGEIHHYDENGIFKYYRHAMNNGITLGIEYIDSDPSKNTFRLRLLFPGWRQIWGIPECMIRPWKVPQDIVDNITNDQTIINSLKIVNDNYYHKENVLNNCKYHWEGMEVFQTRNSHIDSPKDWFITSDYTNFNYSYWVKLVLDE